MGYNDKIEGIWRGATRLVPQAMSYKEQLKALDLFGLEVNRLRDDPMQGKYQKWIIQSQGDGSKQGGIKWLSRRIEEKINSNKNKILHNA